MLVQEGQAVCSQPLQGHQVPTVSMRNFSPDEPEQLDDNDLQQFFSFHTVFLNTLENILW